MSAPAAALATLGHAQPPSSSKKTGPSNGSLQPTVASNLSKEIDALSLHVPIPLLLHIYVLPFLLLYPAAAYIYALRYDDYLGDQANTFIGCVALFGTHALTWLATKWSMAFKARVTSLRVSSIDSAKLVKIQPAAHRGQAEMVPLLHQKANQPNKPDILYFSYQRDKFIYERQSNSFSRLAYPCDDASLTIADYHGQSGLDNPEILEEHKWEYGKNHFDIPIPTFRELFGEHAVAPFFVFQLFTVGLWCLDEYWYYSIFTLFMLVVFECTVVFQRQKTLNEFRTMSIKPYTVNVHRENTWVEIQSDDLLPGDLVSVVRSKEESGLPCDLLLLQGSCIVNEAMLSGESTPLLKESIELRPKTDKLDIAGADRNSVLFGGTKVLQATTPSIPAGSDISAPPDDGCLALVLKTGFGTSQGQLIRTMIFSTERVSANNLESFLFIAFLLVFAIAASAYVWIKGVEQERKRTKLLLDCVIIITSVVPPELPMELSLAVNGSLVALSKMAIFCTEPFRIPFAGRVDICCFDKTGTLTGEDLVVEGIAGVNGSAPRELMHVQASSLETTLTLAAAHALVLLEDGVVGDPMEKTTLESLNWKLGKADIVAPAQLVNLTAKEAKKDEGKALSPHLATIGIKRRFQFSSALKRMSTVSVVASPGNQKRRVFVAVKGAPETLKNMYVDVPADYESTYKWFAQRGSRVLALGYKWSDIQENQVNKLNREDVEGSLVFAGFLVFHCPLKPDAVQTIKMLNDSSHRCLMITGDNPLTASHVARDVEIVDRDVMVLDLREGTKDESDLVWRTVDDSKIIPVRPEEPLDMSILEEYDICMTGAALKQFASTPAWQTLVQHVWVYARVSPAQKEFILTTLKQLGYTTLMAGDGTNDVGALKQAHIGVALLNGSEDDLKKIAEHQKIERFKKVYESQLKLSQRFNAPPPPVPAALAQHYPEIVAAQLKAKEEQATAKRADPYSKFNIAAITDKLSEMEDDSEPPTIKLGDASVAAPFTSKLANVQAITHIIRQGRCTLVATTQMYKILALNCLISAYSLSVQYLDGIKFGDYQVTITGMLMSVCFLCISRARPIEKLSKERPLSNIFNPYIVLSVLLQFSIHIATMLYMTMLCNQAAPRTETVDLEADFKPSLLNSAIYLISLSQQVSTFAVNFQGRPFREGITENATLYYGLLSVAAVALNGTLDLVPEFNRWLQLVDMDFAFRSKLTIIMVLDYGGAYAVDKLLKRTLADIQPKAIITRGLARREARRALEPSEEAKAVSEKKTN